MTFLLKFCVNINIECCTCLFHIVAGILRLRQFPTVFENRLTRYKGLEDFLGRGTKRIYEFNLASVGAMEFNALIATSEHTRRVDGIRTSLFCL